MNKDGGVACDDNGNGLKFKGMARALMSEKARYEHEVKAMEAQIKQLELGLKRKNKEISNLEGENFIAREMLEQSEKRLGRFQRFYDREVTAYGHRYNRLHEKLALEKSIVGELGLRNEELVDELNAMSKEIEDAAEKNRSDECCQAVVETADFSGQTLPHPDVMSELISLRLSVRALFNQYNTLTQQYFGSKRKITRLENAILLQPEGVQILCGVEASEILNDTTPVEELESKIRFLQRALKESEYNLAMVNHREYMRKMLPKLKSRDWRQSVDF